MGDYEELFKFAAKAGALEGYLYERENIECLDNWVSNLEKMYAQMPDNIRKEIRTELSSVLARVSTYGAKVLGDEMKVRLNNLSLKV
jgi:hypothetical protein